MTFGRWFVFAISLPIWLGMAGALVSCDRGSTTMPAAPTSSMIILGGNTMGGTWSVKLPALPARQTAAALQDEITRRLDRLEAEMSGWRADSVVSRFNSCHNTDWFAVSQPLTALVAEAQRVSALTAGAFDITVAPLVDLWGFGPRQPPGGPRRTIPTANAIDAARTHVGYQLLEVRITPPALRKVDPLLTIDLGGIGKGFAADQISVYLDSVGTTDYLIAIGGELRAHGRSGHTPSAMQAVTGWLVGIETPTPDTRRVFTTIDLRNASLSTSGDYRNFIEIDGHRFCHEINPHTGKPIEGNLASVSVVHASGTTADALATALIVLDEENGLNFSHRSKLATLFISRGDGQFKTRSTSEFEVLQAQ